MCFIKLPQQCTTQVKMPRSISHGVGSSRTSAVRENRIGGLGGGCTKGAVRGRSRLRFRRECLRRRSKNRRRQHALVLPKDGGSVGLSYVTVHRIWAKNV